MNIALGDDLRQKVLMITDDLSASGVYTSVLNSLGWEIRAVATSEPSKIKTESLWADVIFADISSCSVNSLNALWKFSSWQSCPPVVLVGAEFEAVNAPRTKSFRIIKETADTGSVISALEVAAKKCNAYFDTRKEEKRNQTPINLASEFLGTSDFAKDIRSKIVSLHDVSSPVLIAGEIGTGKKLLAHLLHRSSKGSQTAFLEYSCHHMNHNSAFETLCGVDGKSDGILAKADRGTVFLKHIESCSAENQRRLVEIAESGVYWPIGAATSKQFKGRIIFSISCSQQELAEPVGVAKDLYYRLSGVRISILSLRQRPEDILTLFQSRLRKSAELYAVEIPQITPADLSVLMAYAWPGNVREVGQVAERWVLARRIQPEIAISDVIGFGEHFCKAQRSLRSATAAFESELISQAIVLEKGRMDAVAAYLGLARRTLNDKISRLGISKKEDMTE